MRPLALSLLLALVLTAPACRSRRLFHDSASEAPATPPATPPATTATAPPAARPTQPVPRPPPRAPAVNTPPAAPGLPLPSGYLGSKPGRGGFVQLSARELAPLDAWIDARNSQWILGDEVLVEASREYFGPVLSIVQRIGSVQRSDEVHPDVTVTTLTFMMGPLQAAVENNPRVMIGTGLTITARRVLRLRLFRTTDGSAPVQLRVTATGEAARGRGARVEQRSTTLQVGGSMRRSPQGWGWYPFG